jgi:hypothetical protein
MDANEYLEKVVAESYKREIDQEENVVRSLPFVATALAVLSTIMIFLRSYVPAYSFNAYPILIWILLVSLGVSIVIIIWRLYLAVRQQSYQYLSPTDQIYTYVVGLRNYYNTLSKTPQEIEEAIIEDIRTFMIQQYTIGATHNQAINITRSGARAQALASLVLALALAYAIVVTISVHEAVKGSASGAILQGVD